MKKIKSKLGESLGFLFEVGFNIGMLTYIEQKELKNNYGDLYSQDLRELSYLNIIRRLVETERIIDRQSRDIIKQWVDFFFQKSFFGGLNFFDEYLSSIGWDRERKQKSLEIVYYQCCFSGNNSINTYYKKDRQVYEEWLSQFKKENRDIKLNTNKYSETGEFLKADTLVYIRYRKKVRILTIDYSIFAIKAIKDFLDLNNIEVLRQILLSDIKYLKSKSVFTNLGMDSKDIESPLSKSLSSYYYAFIRNDKETFKTIQAGSYAYSFYNWLKSEKQIRDDDEIIFNIVGYSDRGMSSLNLTLDNVEVLKTCHGIYKGKPKDGDIQYSREKVLNLIKNKVKRSFNKGEKFIEDLWKIENEGIKIVSHEETFSDYNNYLDRIGKDIAEQYNISPELNLQEAHGELIIKALSIEDDNTYLFLTGNPGIGKTTAISNFLKQPEIIEEGFLFFYISPRTQVNLDIVEKFMEEERELLCDDRLITVNSNSNLIKKNGGKFSVQYRSNVKKERFNIRGVDFIPDTEELEFTEESPENITRQTQTRLTTSYNSKQKGVLNSICEGIYSLFQENHNNIVATVALQSLKKLWNSKTTLEHFKLIFRDVYNSRNRQPIEGRLKEFSQKVKHIIIAIDEITGDKAGVYFLSGISKILKEYGLLNRELFNTKIIVADASIVDSDIIKQHLEETSVEPNKIFFRKAKEISDRVLSIDRFEYNKQKAISINTNSYPAKNLQIKYKTVIQTICFNEINSKIWETNKQDLEKKVDREIIRDINRIQKKYPEEQIIIYIQDKLRLQKIINKLKEKRKSFIRNTDYLEINADSASSISQKRAIQKNKNTAKLIFMTASASRGLSFPNTKHILVDLPRFEIEANLMEVIQVIYRGRGNKDIDNQDKQLIFYLSEQAVYYLEKSEDIQFAIQESKLNILNFLILLHTAIKTRIYGYGKIGRDKYMVIPIGGKSIISAGESLSSRIDRLILQLKKEYGKYNNETRLEKAYIQLEELMKSTDITLTKTNSDRQKLSYLELIDNIDREFNKKLQTNLQLLLDFPKIEKGYIIGSFLVIPESNKIIESYRLKLQDNLTEILNDLQTNTNLTENVQSLINDTLDLIKKLEEQPESIQNLEQYSKHNDRYYAIPLFTLIQKDKFKKYFTNKEKEPEDQRFRDILENYIRSLYSLTQVLPIGYQYDKIPFIVFRSHNLQALRNKALSQKYLFNSSELNVLSLILAESEE